MSEPRTPDDRAEGDIAAYAKWRRDPNRITADSINRSYRAAPRAEGLDVRPILKALSRIDVEHEVAEWHSAKCRRCRMAAPCTTMRAVEDARVLVQRLSRPSDERVR